MAINAYCVAKTVVRSREGPSRIVTTQLQLRRQTVSPDELHAVSYELEALADLNSAQIIHLLYALFSSYGRYLMNLT